MIQKHPQYKENTTRLYPRNRPQYEFKKKSGKIITSSSYNLHRKEYTQYINILQAKQSNA